MTLYDYLFGRQLIIFEDEIAVRAYAQAEAIFENPKTSRGRPFKDILSNSLQGSYVEECVRRLLPNCHYRLSKMSEFDHKDPDTHSYDLVWNNLKIEVKSQESWYNITFEKAHKIQQYYKTRKYVNTFITGTIDNHPSGGKLVTPHSIIDISTFSDFIRPSKYPEKSPYYDFKTAHRSNRCYTLNARFHDEREKRIRQDIGRMYRSAV